MLQFFCGQGSAGKAMDEQLVSIISGYARANLFLEAERIERLARMTEHESRAIYDDLTEGWENIPDKGEGLELLDFRRVERLIRMRLVFTRRAQARGLLHE
jgi:hypothetical protein